MSLSYSFLGPVSHQIAKPIGGVPERNIVQVRVPGSPLRLRVAERSADHGMTEASSVWRGNTQRRRCRSTTVAP